MGVWARTNILAKTRCTCGGTKSARAGCSSSSFSSSSSSSSKRLCIALGLRFEVGESSSAPTARPTGGFRADYRFVGTLDDEIRRDPEREVGYEIIDTWDEMIEGMSEAPVTDETKLGQRMSDFVITVRQDTDEIYERLDDA
nr:hypothetical protein [Tanacetum cinerariifolium]